MFSWQVEFWLAKKVLLKLQGSRAYVLFIYNVHSRRHTFHKMTENQ